VNAWLAGMSKTRSSQRAGVSATFAFRARKPGFVQRRAQQL